MQTAAKSDSGAAVRYIPRIGGKRGGLELNVIQDELGEKTVTRALVLETRLTHWRMDTPSSASVCKLEN
jgi:hypothetical protein